MAGGAVQSPLLSPSPSWIDAVVLVHNVQQTPQAELDKATARLRRVGISEIAVVENFA